MSRRLLAWSAGLCLAVLAATALFVAVAAPQARAEAVREWRVRLASLAVDRAAAIDLWLSDGLEDARLVASYPTVQYLVGGHSSGPRSSAEDAGAEAHLEELLGEVAAAGGYVAASLVDVDGDVFADWPNGERLGPRCFAAGLRTVTEGSAGVGVCTHGAKGPLVLFLAPVEGSGARVLVAADPEAWLYPFVAGEPLPTSTSETVLMVRDGDEAVFIAPLRHLAGEPLNIRRPLSTPGFAAHAALTGVRSVGPYVDYRGVPVLAATRRLERSGWGLVVKVDEAEVMAPVRRRVTAEAVAVAGVLLALGVGGLALGRHFRGRRMRERLADLEQREALRRERDRALAGLELQFQSLPIGLIVTEPDLTMVSVNPAAERMFGYSRDEMVGRDPFGLIMPETARPFMEGLLARLEAGDETLDGVNDTLTKDGRTLTCHWSNTPLRDKEGRLVGIMATVQDITARKEAEDALRASEALYQDLAETSQDLIWRCDAEGRYTYLNPAWEKVFGYSREEMLGRLFSDFQSAEVAARDRREFALLLAEGSVVGYETTHLARDGHEVHLVFSAKTVVDEDGRPTGTRGTAYDVTERKQAEAALRRSEQKLLAVLDATPFPVAIVDIDDEEIQYWSRSAVEKFGHTAPTAPEWYRLAYPDPEYRRQVVERWKPFLEKARKSKVPVNTGEYQVTCKDGSVRTCELYATFIEENLIVTFNDVTERKRAENALAANERRYRELFTSIQEGFAIHEIILDEAGEPVDYRFIDINPAFTRLVGLGPEVIGRTVLEVLPGTEPEWIERYGRVALTGEPCRFESYSDQLDKHFEVSAFSPSRGRFATAFVDITARKRAEEALAANEERFRQLFESMSDGVAVYRTVDDGADFVFTELNPAGERVSQVTRERVLGKKVTEVFPGIEEMGLLEVFRRVWRDGTARRHPMTRYEDDRLSQWVENLVYRLPTGEIVAVYSDATERKRAETELAESERAMATLMSNLPGMAYRCANRPDRPMEVVSEGSLAVTGYSPEELLEGGAVSYGEVIVPEDRDPVWQQVQEAIAARRPFELNYRITTRDGEARSVWERGRAIMAKNGDVLAFEGFIADVTERRAAEEAVRRERDRAQRYLDLAGVMFVALDRDGRVTLVNPRACEVLEVEPNDILGHDWFAEFVPAGERRRVRRAFERLMADELEPIEYFENRVRTGTGESRLVSWHNALLRDGDGAIQGTLSSGEDITDSRAAAESLRKLRLRLAEAEEAERRRLARELHDQVGQSLTALGINLSIVRQRISEESGAEVGQRLDDSRALVDEVVSQVRDVMAELRPPVLDDYGLAAALEWTAGRLDERTGIKCKIVAGGGETRLPAPIETALFRIAQEALTNVARHAGPCSVEIELDVGTEQVRLAVRDDGAGFDPASIPVGRMGLAGMGERAEGVGGALEVSAAPGRGVTVVAEVPLEVL